MAPELYSGQQYDGPPVDIFALGVMLFMILTAMEPFKKVDDIWYRRLMHDPVRAMDARKIPIDPSALDLIVKMVKFQPSERISMDQVMQHPWITAEKATQTQVADYFMQVKLARA